MLFGGSPMINWSFLDYFMAAAKEQNFSKAAQSLYYSQSYLSKKIAALEEELGVTLFERHGKKVILTAAGEHLYQKALKIKRKTQRIRMMILVSLLVLQSAIHIQILLPVQVLVMLPAARMHMNWISL